MELSYDLLLRGGHLIDPRAGLNGTFDVAVQTGSIAAVGRDIPTAKAKEVIDVRGRLVLPGLIDSHAHVFQHAVGRFGLNPELVGVRSGVTTLVDMGCASYMSMSAFRHYIVELADTRIYSFISIYPAGEGHLSPELYGAGVDVDLCVACIEGNRDLIRGIKVDAEIGSISLYGLDKVEQAKQVSRETGLPLYVHVGQLFPAPEDAPIDYDLDKIVPHVVALLEPGDILAHPFSRHPGGFVDTNGVVHPIIKEGLERGLCIDIGHGSHFSFRTARRVLDAGIKPTTLGADLHGYNTRAPADPGVPEKHPDPEMAPFGTDARFSLTHAMVELLALGLTLEEVVPMVTSRCADTLEPDGELGTLRVGGVADVTVLADEPGRWVLTDNEENRGHSRADAEPVVLSPGRPAFRSRCLDSARSPGGLSLSY